MIFLRFFLIFYNFIAVFHLLFRRKTAAAGVYGAVVKKLIACLQQERRRKHLVLMEYLYKKTPGLFRGFH